MLHVEVLYKPLRSGQHEGRGGGGGIGRGNEGSREKGGGLDIKQSTEEPQGKLGVKARESFPQMGLLD